MSRSLRSILLLPVLILLVGTACNLSGGSTPPIPLPTVPPQEQPIEQQVQTLQSDPNTDPLTITLTEAQVTAYIVENMQKEYASILSDPAVLFKPDQVELYGTIKGGAISAPGKVTLSITVDPDG